MKFEIKGIKSTLQQISDSFKTASEKNLVLSTNAMFKELREKTPVDTGRARDSWKVEKGFQGYKVINEVPYIERLNAGSSKQAPAHFVEATALKYGTPQGSIIEPT
jgi:hypothetical protein